MIKIKLTQDLFAMVDDEDYDSLNLFKWHFRISKNGNIFYAVRNDKKFNKPTVIMMHNDIMNPIKGFIVDHRDGDGLNNQKDNLRICTYSQNSMNQKPQKGRSSRFKGVSRTWNNDWRAGIFVDGKQKFLGCYNKEEDAALAYNRAALKYFGEFAFINQVY